MIVFLSSLLLPLVRAHVSTRFQSSNARLTSDQGVVRYFDSIGGCASHCISHSKRNESQLFLSDILMKAARRSTPGTTVRTPPSSTEPSSVSSPQTPGRSQQVSL